MVLGFGVVVVFANFFIEFCLNLLMEDFFGFFGGRMISRSSEP